MCVCNFKAVSIMLLPSKCVVVLFLKILIDEVQCLASLLAINFSVSFNQTIAVVDNLHSLLVCTDILPLLTATENQWFCKRSPDIWA